jgi:hypothetical protein
MKKYFDNLPNINLYIIFYASYKNMKKNVSLGHVHFF